jgi:uncharacterized Zn finger protein (UPF0148 family)
VKSNKNKILDNNVNNNQKTLSGIRKMLLKVKKGFKMAKQKCQKCGKIWHGWA